MNTCPEDKNTQSISRCADYIINQREGKNSVIFIEINLDSLRSWPYLD